MELPKRRMQVTFADGQIGTRARSAGYGCVSLASRPWRFGLPGMASGKHLNIRSERRPL